MVEGALVAKDEEVEITVPCVIKLATGGSISFDNVTLQSRDLILTDEAANGPSALTLKDSTLRGTQAASTFTLDLSDSSDSAELTGTLIDYASAVWIHIAARKDESVGGGEFIASNSTIRSLEPGSEGIVVLAGSAGGTITLNKVNFEVANPDALLDGEGGFGVFLYAQFCTQIEVKGSPTEDCGGLPPVDPAAKVEPAGLSMDTRDRGETDSNVNGIVESGETVLLKPSWSNSGETSASITGSVSDVNPPAGPIFEIVDGTADYGTLASEETAPCLGTLGCYVVKGISPSPRPVHADAHLAETLSTGHTKRWTLHIGNSFADVPTDSQHYREIETILHNGVTVGCGADKFCPGRYVPRAQLAVFMARAAAGADIPAVGQVDGQDYRCLPAGGKSLFGDVDPGSFYCRHVHYAAAQHFMDACTPGNFCPNQTVTRSEIAVSTARAHAKGDAGVPATYGPDPETGRSYSCNATNPNLHFTDVAASASYCRHVHYVWAKGIAGGTSDTKYSPSADVTRAQTAEFLTNGFALRLDKDNVVDPSDPTELVAEKQPTISFSAGAYSEGEAVGSAKLEVIRGDDTSKAVSVDYATSNGTAAAGSDYTAATGTLSFAAGETTKTFTVAVTNDTAAEGDETINLALSNPTGGAVLVGPSSATLSILDDDAKMSFSSATYSVSEQAATATITVNRQGASTAEVAVSYATSNGTAAAGSDYTAASGTVSFAAGETAKTFTVPITNDTLSEPDETVNLALSAPTGGAVLAAPSSAVLTIADNDPLFAFSSAAYNTPESGSATITVNRQNAASVAAAVSYATSNGTAAAGADYTATSGTLSFAAGESSKTFSVPVTADTSPEADETVNLSLSNPTGGGQLGSPATAVLTINDNDPVFAFSSAAYSVGEAAGAATVTVTRQSGASVATSVGYATSNATAVAGSDYTASSGALSFAAGESSKTFAVSITNDSDAEANETLNLALSNPTNGAVLGTPSSATLTISDNDPQIKLSSVSYVAPEASGQATVTVLREGGPSMAVAVNYSTSDETATAGSDYTATSGSLSFAAGETSKAFAVPVANDTLAEAEETLAVTLSSPTGEAALAAPSAATLTIADNDPAIAFSAAAYSVGEAGGSASVTVTRSGGATVSAAADYATSNGTAAAGSDYTAASGAVSFAAGETSKTFAVPIADDASSEADETVNLALSSPSAGAALASPSTAVLTILDNDPLLLFSSATYSTPESASATITVNRQGGISTVAAVSYATSNGTAAAGSDYTAASGSVSFAAGETSKTFSVPIANDTTPEADETVNLALSSPSGGAQLGSPSTAVLTINDNDPAFQFTASSFSASESTGQAVITVVRHTGVSVAASVAFATSDATAVSGSDYTAVASRVNFAAGEASKALSVPITGDTGPEPDETIELSLSNPSPGAALGSPSAATLTIVDDDPQFSMSSSGYSPAEYEGVARVTVNRQGGLSMALETTVSTGGGTATPAADYQPVSTTLSFAPGQATKDLSIPVVDDSLQEPNETFRVSLSSPSAGAVLAAPDSATVRILDHVIRFNSATYVVNEGAGSITIPVLRGDRTDTSVEVRYNISEGTAQRRLDFTGDSGKVAFAVGESQKSFTIPIVDDALTEQDETIILSLSNPTGDAVLGVPSQATVTIEDNEGASGFLDWGDFVPPWLW